MADEWGVNHHGRARRLALADAEVERKRRVRPMSVSERLTAAQQQRTQIEQLERAEQAMREGAVGTPMFSEHETYDDFHFGTDIPTGVMYAAPREVQSGDDMAGPQGEARGARIFVGVLVIAVAAILLLAWAFGAGR